MKKDAYFISLEGGEGTGKSTQITLLRDRLEKLGIEVISTREPGGCDSAELIRDFVLTGDTDRWTPMTEALLFTAARKEHTHRIIKPTLEQGKWVITDRYFDSTLAYQGGGHGLGIAKMRELTRLALDDFEPDMTIILDIDIETGLERAGNRLTETSSSEDRFERMGTPFHQTLRQAMLTIAEREPERCSVIDASGDIELVHARIWSAVAQRFELQDG